MPLPPLPSLPTEWHATVFANQTFQNSNESQHNFTLLTIERLAFIGDAILQLCIVEWQHERCSASESVAELTYEKGKYLSEIPRVWAKKYKLSSKVVLKASSSSVKPQSSTANGDLFRAYLAAVYLSGGGGHEGFDPVIKLVKGILDSNEDESSRSGGSSADDEPIEKHEDKMSKVLNDLCLPRKETLQPKAQAPSTSHVRMEAQTSHNSLSLLNERAMQKRIQLTWGDVESGPDHAKNWAATLTVMGKKYEGVGQSKKVARCQAAENALKDLKW